MFLLVRLVNPQKSVGTVVFMSWLVGSDWSNRHRNTGVLTPGDTITIRYLRSDPTNVIADESHFARDFTLWFVAAKLLFGAPFIFGSDEIDR